MRKHITKKISTSEFIRYILSVLSWQFVVRRQPRGNYHATDFQHFVIQHGGKSTTNTHSSTSGYAAALSYPILA